MQPNHTRSRSLVPPAWWAIFALTLLVALLLRVWGLPGIPPGPHYDEAANGILAAEIATGARQPLFIPSYTGKEVLFFYGAASLMRLLGDDLLALRLTAALFGLLSVAAMAWLGYELFVEDAPEAAPWLAGFSAILAATSFWHVLLSRVGFRAVTQPLLQTLTLAALWRGLRRGGSAVSPSRGSTGSLLRNLIDGATGWALLAGLLCGLTGYTYLAARAFPLPLVVAFAALLIVDDGQRRRRLLQISLFGLAALLGFSPLGLYFVRHPAAFTNRIAQVGPGGDLRAALDGIAKALQMLFLKGDPYIRFNLPYRPLFGAVPALLLGIGLLVTAWHLLRPQVRGGGLALARAREVLLLAWVPAMLLPTALAVGEISPSNLRAVGLVPLVFVLPARGLWTLLSDRRFETWKTVLLGLAAAGLLLLTAVNTARLYFDAYASRTDLYEASDGDLADIAAYLNRADLTDTAIYVASIHYRHPTLAFLAEDYGQIKWLVGASSVVYPAQGEAIYLFPRSARPEEGWLTRYLAAATPLPAPVAADGAPAFAAYHLDWPPALPHDALADYSGVARLLSLDVDRAVSGQELDLTAVWQIDAPPPHPDLIPFYHVVDPWGGTWGQAQPFQYAAEDWTPGEVVIHRVRVPLAAGMPPGAYQLQVGLYSPGAASRLAVVAAGGRVAGTTATLDVNVARAAVPPEAGALGIRTLLDLETPDGLRLLGANLDAQQVRPGERVHLSLFWQAGKGEPGYPDYTVNLSLAGSDGTEITLYDGAPVHGAYPTSLWREGERVLDRYNPRLPLEANPAPVGDYTLGLVLQGPAGDARLGPVALGELELVETDRLFEMPPMGYAQHQLLGDQVELLGYDLDLANAIPGGVLRLTLYWRALSEMEAGYTVFTHLLGPGGQTAAQQDNPPVNGSYPTTLWLPGEIVPDPYQISLPEDLAPGEYPLEVGLYLPENGLRLGDAIRLDTLVSVGR